MEEALDGSFLPTRPQVDVSAGRTAPCVALASRLGPLVTGRRRTVSKALAEPSRDWPAACGELPTMTKLRPVNRVSAGQFVRTLPHSHAHTDP